MGLKSVTFSSAEGGGFHDVYVDTTGAPYDTPHWEDNSDSAQNKGYLDGDAEDWDANPADHQYPVCYESLKKVRVTVLFLANPHAAFDGATIEGGDLIGAGLHFGPTNVDFVTIGGKDYARAQIESADPLCNVVDWYNPLEITWTLVAPDRSTAGTSANEMFVTLGAPLCATLYRTVAYLACHNGGAIDTSAALASTWAMFSTGTAPANVCGWNAAHAYIRPKAPFLEGGGHRPEHDGRTPG